VQPRTWRWLPASIMRWLGADLRFLLPGAYMYSIAAVTASKLLYARARLTIGSLSPEHDGRMG
jgi:hypothetical protein